MKRIFTTFVLAFIVVFGLQAQGQRIALIEHFTQASCGPCATQNPLIRPVVVANEEKIAIIHHQVNWPGFDPMNEQNPGDVRVRVDYYGVRGVPRTVLDGVTQGTPSSIVTQANIDNIHRQTTKMDLDLQVDATPAFDGLNIELSMTAEQAISGNYYAHVVVTEEEINWSSPPGSNGERVFHHVLKKSLPNSQGTQLSSDWSNGMTASLSFDYKFENFYDWQNAGVVAFVQNRTTKEIIQAVHWKPSFEANQGDDVLVQRSAASGVFGEDFVCGDQAEPIITVMNGGSTPLTAFEVEYSINGGAKEVYNWTGRALGTFETKELVLPTVGFPIKDIGELSVEVRKPNGQDDVVPSNGSNVSDFLPSPNTTTESEIRVKPIIRPQDVSFKVLNSAGDVVLEDGPFTERKTYTYPITFDENECYTIEVENNSINLNATFQVYDRRGDRVLNGVASTRGTFSRDFSSFPPVSTENLSQVAEWTISPNPGVNDFTINAEVSEEVDVNIQVTDFLGKLHSAVETTWSAGSQTQYINLSTLPNGIYLVSIKSGDKITTKKWLKQ